MENLIATEIANSFAGVTGNKKYYAVMLFETELNLGISSKPNKWVNVGNLYFSRGIDALNYYSNIPNPASQLIDAESAQELETEMNKRIENFKSEKWLNENLYPYM